MRRVDRTDLRAPARVIDLELTDVPESSISVEHYSSLWCLSRQNGVPREISFWDVAEDVSISQLDLLADLRTQLSADGPNVPGPRAQNTSSLDATVVVCTRNRPIGLRTTLSSLQHQTDPDFSVLVVDNSSTSHAAAGVVEELNLSRSKYTVEPHPGLSRARNKALGVVDTELVAWIDDDEVADPDWVRRLKEGFTHEARPAAVCGLMLPAELEFEAQVRFEQYGGFNKGRGVAPEVLLIGAPSVESPLYPLPAFGPGGNMAFRTELLRSIGGFDPCLGAGTRTHGGEETRALSLLLSEGKAVLHWPAAITWHTHRQEMAALRKQFYGYSAGLSAFYASMIRSRPAILLDILRLAPHALRDLRRGGDNLRSGYLPDDFPRCLQRAALRGVLEGWLMYVYEAFTARNQAVSVAQEA